MSILLADHYLNLLVQQRIEESRLHGDRDISDERKAARTERASADPKALKNRIGLALRHAADKVTAVAGIDTDLEGHLQDELEQKRRDERAKRAQAIAKAAFARRNEHRKTQKLAKSFKHGHLQGMTVIDDPEIKTAARDSAKHAAAVERMADRLKRKRTAQGWAAKHDKFGRKVSANTPDNSPVRRFEEKDPKKGTWPRRPKRFQLGKQAVFNKSTMSWDMASDLAKSPSLVDRIKGHRAK